MRQLNKPFACCQVGQFSCKSLAFHSVPSLASDFWVTLWLSVWSVPIPDSWSIVILIKDRGTSENEVGNCVCTKIHIGAIIISGCGCFKTHDSTPLFWYMTWHLGVHGFSIVELGCCVLPNGISTLKLRKSQIHLVKWIEIHDFKSWGTNPTLLRNPSSSLLLLLLYFTSPNRYSRRDHPSRSESTSETSSNFPNYGPCILLPPSIHCLNRLL